MRTKKQELYLHKASTQETLTCLSYYPKWCKILLGRGKKYDDFLVKLIEKNFYNDDDQDRTIKHISSDIGFKPSSVTNWITEIYNDILILNSEQTELFKSDGIEHTFYFRFFDNRAYFTIWLPQSLRKYENFYFIFIRAKLSVSNFWVKKVDHHYENDEYKVSVMLEGKTLNQYREQLVERALFDGVLSFHDVYLSQDKKDFEIDEILHQWYKPKP